MPSTTTLQILGSMALLVVAGVCIWVAVTPNTFCKYGRETLIGTALMLIVQSCVRIAAVPFGLVSQTDARTINGLIGVVWAVVMIQVLFSHLYIHRQERERSKMQEQVFRHGGKA